MPYVTYHARERFALRVSAAVDPVSAVLKMWSEGRAPRWYEYTSFRVHPFEGTTYRICQHGLVTVMLLMREGCIVTVLDQNTGVEIVKVRK